MTDFEEIYYKNNPLLQELKKIDIKDLYKIFDTFINGHVDKDKSIYSGIFKCGHPRLIMEYNEESEIREVIYTINFYDCISLRMSCISVLLEFKMEHNPKSEVLVNMDFDRFFEFFISRYFNLKIIIFCFFKRYSKFFTFSIK